MYHQLEMLTKLEFKYLAHQSAMQEVQELASKLHQYPIHHVIAGDYIFLKYDRIKILHFVERIKPWNALVLLSSPDQPIDVLNLQNDTNILYEIPMKTEYQKKFMKGGILEVLGIKQQSVNLGKAAHQPLNR